MIFVTSTDGNTVKLIIF